MQFKQFVETVKLKPSITAWTRIEPRPRESSLQRSLQAQVADPAWTLARQWMFAEFLGDDAGSPVQATLGMEFRTVTTYRPGTDDSKTMVIDSALPIEVHVEREPVELLLRGAVQLGLYFENLVAQSPSKFTDEKSVINAFRRAFKIGSDVPDPALSSPDARRYRSLVANRVTDGVALYKVAPSLIAGQALPPGIAPADNDAVRKVLQGFVDYRRSLFSEPDHDSAWQPRDLKYNFALGSPVSNQAPLLNAPEFPGGHLDWHAFSIETGQPNDVTAANPAQVTPVAVNFLPQHVVFRGMPESRWWRFEDSVTDFGQLDADHVDLPKLLVMEFALGFGNDWFWVLVPVPIGAAKVKAPGAGSDPQSEPRGTLTRVTTLVVTDTFGVRTLIRPAEQTKVNPGDTPWSMYKLSGKNSRSDFILMLPTLGHVDDADPLEEVLFLRDEMAAMAWAVEQQLQGDLDSPVNGHEIAQQMQKAPSGPSLQPGGPKIYYTIQADPPANCIPMVSVQAPDGGLYFRRGQFAVPSLSQFPKASVLEPDRPFFLADRVVGRSGIQVDRYFRRTRASDGKTLVWMARKSTQGRGPGGCRLKFDLVRDIPPTP